MTPQEIIQAKVIAMNTAGPGASIEQIKERFEFLAEDALKEAFDSGYKTAQFAITAPKMAVE